MTLISYSQASAILSVVDFSCISHIFESSSQLHTGSFVYSKDKDQMVSILGEGRAKEGIFFSVILAYRGSFITSQERVQYAQHMSVFPPSKRWITCFLSKEDV